MMSLSEKIFQKESLKQMSVRDACNCLHIVEQMSPRRRNKRYLFVTLKGKTKTTV